MPKIRHIALATNDPEKTANFYKEAFGFKEVGRISGNSPKALAHGYYLSDGTLNLAILKFKTDQLGKGLDFVGIHHFGIIVEEDVDQWIEKLEEMGAPCFMKRDEAHGNAFFETKFRGPDGVVFDISDHPWVGSAGHNAETAEPRRSKEKEKVAPAE